MTARRLLTMLFALLALAVVPATASAEIHQWAVNWNEGNTLNASTEYELVNLTGGRIGYQDRTGADVGWTASGGNFEFRRGNRDHRSTPLKATEPVAIYNTATKKYLVNEWQPVGINLDWSSTPKYEWRVETWRTGQRSTFSLYNTNARDYVVYGKRTFGINLDWEGGGLAHTTFRLTHGTYQYPKGYFLYQGATSLDAKDTVKVLKNFSQYPVRFFRQGEDYLGSGQVPDVSVAPGAQMTEAQMKLVFGSATPRMTGIRAYTTASVPATEIALRVSYVDG
jgi:hypothetical protein